MEKIVGIWEYYFNTLPIEPYEIDIYGKIIYKIKHKLENKLELTMDDKHKIIELIQLLYMECDYYCIKVLEPLEQKLKQEINESKETVHLII